MEQQETPESLSPDPSGEAAMPEPEPTAPAAELAAEKEKNQDLLRQNRALEDENVRLKEKIRALQRQVNRLYDIREMRALERSLQSQPEPAPQTDGNDDARATLARLIAEQDGAARPEDPSEKPAES